jgi:hypothetical protein
MRPEDSQKLWSSFYWEAMILRLAKCECRRLLHIVLLIDFAQRVRATTVEPPDK